MPSWCSIPGDNWKQLQFEAVLCLWHEGMAWAESGTERVRSSQSFSSFCLSSPQGKARICDKSELLKYNRLHWFSLHSTEAIWPWCETSFKARLRAHHFTLLSLELINLANFPYESIWENQFCSHEVQKNGRLQVTCTYIHVLQGRLLLNTEEVLGCPKSSACLLCIHLGKPENIKTKVFPVSLIES